MITSEQSELAAIFAFSIKTLFVVNNIYIFRKRICPCLGSLVFWSIHHDLYGLDNGDTVIMSATCMNDKTYYMFLKMERAKRAKNCCVFWEGRVPSVYQTDLRGDKLFSLFFCQSQRGGWNPWTPPPAYAPAQKWYFKYYIFLLDSLF